MAVAAPPATFTGKVCSVLSGDSLTVIDVTNRHHRIHLRGVDAPEPQQDFGSEARKGLVDLVFGKTMTIEVIDRGEDGL
jgi:endonuclease YncB( thermonuclease family)